MEKAKPYRHSGSKLENTEETEERELIAAYKHIIGDTNIMHVGLLLGSSSSLEGVRPSEPDSTGDQISKLNTPSQKEKFKYQDNTYSEFMEVNNMLTIYRNQLAEIPQVVRIEYILRGRSIDVWTFIEDSSLETRDQIYNAQSEAVKELDDFAYDFHVISNPSKTLPNAKVVYSKD